MFSLLKLILASFFTIIIADYIWLGLIAKKFYVDQLTPIGRITGDKFEPILWAAAIVYLLLAVGIVFFALPKVDLQANYGTTFAIGALLGLVVYGVYDMTNYLTLKDYPIQIALADTAWGSVVCGLATMAARFVRDM